MNAAWSIAERVEDLRRRAAEAAVRAGRRPGDVELMAVTKLQPAEAALKALAAGIRFFGENRVQEAAAKYGPGLRAELPGAELHLVGQLQRNKVNKALALFDALQSVDSLDLVEALLSRLGARTSPLGIYFELRTGEDTKSGFSKLDELFVAVQRCLEAKAPLDLRGLMTVAPLTDRPNERRRAFRTLAEAREEVRRRFGLSGFYDLSMGMSSDFETAIEEGATMVRIGTAIFGERVV